MIIRFKSKFFPAATVVAAILSITVSTPNRQAYAENTVPQEPQQKATKQDNRFAALERRIGAVETDLAQLARADSDDNAGQKHLPEAPASPSAKTVNHEQPYRAPSLFDPDPFDDGVGLAGSYGLQFAQVKPKAPVAPVAPRKSSGSSQSARPKSEKDPDQLLVEAGGVLLRPGTLQIEPSLEYGHFSADRLAINGLNIQNVFFIGVIRADDIDRDVVTGALTFRYGIFNRFQMDFRVPYVWREDSETLGVGTSEANDRRNSNNGVGDVQLGFSTQLFLARGSMPAVILRLDGSAPTGEHPFEIETEVVGPGEARLTKPPTGSGFYQTGANLTMVWTSDPVVFFGGGGYTYTWEREFDGFGKIDPGDLYRFFVGMNVGLNERVSLNVSFTDQITGRTRQNGNKTANSAANDARLIIGTSIGLGPGRSMLVSATTGLTEAAPDFSFNVSLPITF